MRGPRWNHLESIEAEISAYESLYVSNLKRLASKDISRPMASILGEQQAEFRNELNKRYQIIANYAAPAEARTTRGLLQEFSDDKVRERVQARRQRKKANLEASLALEVFYE